MIHLRMPESRARLFAVSRTIPPLLSPWRTLMSLQIFICRHVRLRRDSFRPLSSFCEGVSAGKSINFPRSEFMTFSAPQLLRPRSAAVQVEFLKLPCARLTNTSNFIASRPVDSPTTRKAGELTIILIRFARRSFTSEYNRVCASISGSSLLSQCFLVTSGEAAVGRKREGVDRRR